MTAKTNLISTLVIVMGASLLGSGAASAAGKTISAETLHDMWRANPVLVQADGLGDYDEDYRVGAGKAVAEAAVQTRLQSRPAPAAEAEPQNASLQQVWRSNPIFAQPDELSDYADDYRASADAGRDSGPVFGGYVTAGFAELQGARQEAADRQAALRKLWHSDPRFSQVDELSDYAEDFRANDDPAQIVAARNANRAG